jgi:hypothetical protein
MGRKIGKPKHILGAFSVSCLLLASCIQHPLQSDQRDRIAGVYVREVSESCGGHKHSYQIFRFYEDGTVLYVPLCLDGLVANNWKDIGKWFSRENAATDINRGKYIISNNRISFSTSVQDLETGSSYTREYSGTHLDSELTLDVRMLVNGYTESGMKYLKIGIK